MNIHRRYSTVPEQFEFAFCSEYPTHGIIAALPVKHHVESVMTPDEIFAKWEPLAYSCVEGWNIPGYDRDDLVQEARMTIHKMASRFDSSRGSFYTVAKRAIKNRLSTISTHGRRQKRTANLTSLDETIDNGDEGSNATLHDVLEAAAGLPSALEMEEILSRYLERLSNRRCKDVEKRNSEIDLALEKVYEEFGIRLDRPESKIAGSKPAALKAVYA